MADVEDNFLGLDKETLELIENYIPEKISTSSGIVENERFTELSPMKKRENASTGRKIVKRVARVKLMDDFEKAKAEGLIQTIKFVLKYVYGVNGIDNNFIKKIKEKYSNAKTPTKVICAVLLLATLPITSELLLTALSIIGTVSGCKVGYYLLTAPEVADGLKDAGVYNTVMKNLDRLSEIYPNLTSNMYKNKVDEINNIKLADQLLMKGK